jgi:precorrin-6A/cobalt-precorrin-6A reductase
MSARAGADQRAARRATSARADGRVLVLGGTAEARALAGELHERGLDVVSSLAGRVSRPRLPAGEVRIGGFGGPRALAAWLGENGVRAVVDATHPFARRISASAALACEEARVPLVRLERPGWSERAGDRWRWVDTLEQAAALVPALGRRAFLTTGRQGLSSFAGVRDVWFLVRCVERPEPPLPAEHELLLDRGPYTVAGELDLIDRHAIEVLVTKDSGGGHTAAKLDAARERRLPVIVVRRPARPEGVLTLASVAETVRWAQRQAGYRRGV